MSGAFFLCFFGLSFITGGQPNFDSWLNVASLLAFISLPATLVAFVVTPGRDNHIENCSRGDSLLAGAGITALAYLSSLAVLFFPLIVKAPPTNFVGLIEFLNNGLLYVWVGAWLALLPALPFGMFGGVLYRHLAKRTLSTH